MAHKAGFVNIVGNPNVGKSTLMNILLGEKLSIITSKSQTTRHRILGIYNEENYQILYSDTPGILKPAYQLQKSMLKMAMSALEDADILLYITDIFENKEKNNETIEQINKLNIPILVLINKIDISNQNVVEQQTEYWHNKLPEASILPVSALLNFNIDKAFNFIIHNLPESPPYFPKDQLSDKTERFFVSEIIREKILLNYQKEIPYASEVEVDEFKDQEDIIRIKATIYVSRTSHKGIIIGNEGKAIKKLGIDARKEIEEWVGKKVFVELYVRVNKDWRDKKRELRKFGYE